MKIIITGAAGFIGYYLVKKLCYLGHRVIGIDNINAYYDVNLKKARLNNCGISCKNTEYGKKVNSTTLPSYAFIRLDLTDNENLLKLFEEEKFDCVCNMAAQAGVRYSIENPHVYIDSNISGFFNILEACRTFPIEHLVFASSSSVYGINEKTPFSIKDRTDQPASLYAATKKSNELMAHTYSHLYNIPITGLRFFTVYGPWGRPDMAYFKFAKNIVAGKAIEVYNNGDMLRDFTYIDDIIEGIVAAIERVPSLPPPFSIYNLGNNRPVKLTDFIEILEDVLGQKTERKYLGMQAGDVPVTMADIENTRCELGWKPKTSVKEGLRLFADWFLQYNKGILQNENIA